MSHHSSVNPISEGPTMAYVQKANATAPRSNNSYSSPKASAPKEVANSPKRPEGENKSSHTLSVMIKEGEGVDFINVTGLFPGETKDGRAMSKVIFKEPLS